MEDKDLLIGKKKKKKKEKKEYEEKCQDNSSVRGGFYGGETKLNEVREHFLGHAKITRISPFL